MFYRIRSTHPSKRSHREGWVQASNGGEAVLHFCRTTGVRTFHTAVLEVRETLPPGMPILAERSIKAHFDPDVMPERFDRECEEHDRSFTAEVLAGAR